MVSRNFWWSIYVLHILLCTATTRLTDTSRTDASEMISRNPDDSRILWFISTSNFSCGYQSTERSVDKSRRVKPSSHVTIPTPIINGLASLLACIYVYELCYHHEALNTFWLQQVNSMSYFDTKLSNEKTIVRYASVCLEINIVHLRPVRYNRRSQISILIRVNDHDASRIYETIRL
jgi:hypothetical protein